MKKYRATIKETSGAVLHPEFFGDVSREYLIKFWGLNEPDVVEWSIEEIND